MSLPKPTGLKAPSGSKLARPSGGIPQKSGLLQPGSLSRAQSAIAKSARAAGLNASVAEKYAADAAQAFAGEEELSGPAPPPQPADDFIIGDRVFVSGSKPGFIAFLGDTQFAPGEWAGVVLDEMIGKNDGAVNGVRYFQCEPKRGVFCRISKLSRTPGISGSGRSDGDTSEVSAPQNGDSTPVNKRPTTPSMLHRPTTPSHGESRVPRPTTPSHGESRLHRPTTPSLSKSVNKSLSSSSTSLNQGHAPSKVRSESVTSTPASSGSIKHNLHVGDRVLVSGSKLGTLRYIGPADFAKGEWVGVELDDPLGKNDGAVAGKRYFDCRPRYGLFAPVHKVTKASSSSTPSPMTRSLGSAGMRMSRERSGSQDSVSSLSSATSSASRPRVRLGVSGLGNNQNQESAANQSAGRSGQRPSTLNISATTSALQKALKEKEEHIEQLLRERDLERSEVARAAAQVDEAQNQLIQLKTEKDRVTEESEESIQQLKAMIQKLASEKHDLVIKLDDEKRKVEDLQFRIEEEVISKDDLESRTEEEEAKMRDLEKALKREKDRAEKLETELFTVKALTERQANELANVEDTQTTYLDQIEELTHKLTQAELKIQAHDSSRLEEGAKTSQVSLELEEKTSKVLELEDFLSLKNKEVKQLQEKLTEMKDELMSRSAKVDKLQHQYEEMTEKLKANEVLSNNLSIECQNLKSQNADLERKAKDSQDRFQQLNEEKSHLESQVAEMMKNSGDSSHQLSMLNEQLGQKNRKIEDLQADLSTSTQKWHNLNNKLETSMREKEREIETLTSKYEEIKSNLTSNLDDVQKELEKAKTKIVNMDKDFEIEKENLLKRKDKEISELKQQLETAAENVSKQEIQTQAHKQVLDTITMEKDSIQFEKDKFEKQVKRLESERESLNSELIQLKVEASKSQSAYDQIVHGKTSAEEKIQDLVEEKERLEKSIAELQKGKEDVQSEKEKISGEKDQFQREALEGRVALQQKEMQVEELQKEIEKLKQETSNQQETINQLSQATTDSGAMQKKLAEQMSQVESLKKKVADSEGVANKAKQTAEKQEEELRAAKIELEETQETVTLLEDSIKELERERDSLTSQLQGALEARKEQDKVLDLNQKLNEEIETIQQKHRKEVEGLKAAKASLQQEMDNATTLCEQKEAELRAKLSQISNLENEKSTLIGYKSSNEKLEKETVELKGKINQLQSKLSESKANANIINNVESKTTNMTDGNNEAVDKLKEDYELAQGQVQFLNSVIVDLQHKNEELKTRLEAMEQGVTNGADDSMDISTPNKRAAPRVFCDICDVFDQHETEDCPLQEMSDSPPQSHHHGDRHQVRPYCDICEEFHPPCPGLSLKKVVQSGAEPIDPKAKVENWVKTVDTVTSELASESEKVFGNDGEFFHVLQESAGFRDSGYYDGVDSNPKSPFDTKPGTSLLSSLMEITDKDKQDIWEKLKKEATAADVKVFNYDLDKSKALSEVEKADREKNGSANDTKEIKAVLVRPRDLDTEKQGRLNVDSTAPLAKTPASMTSASDSEYQSGKESLDSESPSGTPDMETSVDTGEVFQADNAPENDGKTDTDRTAENCTIS